MTLEQVEGTMAPHGKVFGCVVQADARRVFGKGHIQGSLKSVFDGPMGAGGVENGFGIRR